MRHMDIFTGIGGWPYGLSLAFGPDYQPVAFCERDEFCRRVLRKHWPDVPITDDVFNLKGGDYGPVDILSCSPPCQPYSVAGNRRGSGDDRALWPEVVRVLREMEQKPRWLCVENVPGLLSIEQGMAFEQMLLDLEGEGYTTGTLIVPTVAVDAPHRRDRVWIVGHATKQSGDGSNDYPGIGMERKAFSQSGNTDRTNLAADANGERLPHGWQAGQRTHEPQERNGMVPEPERCGSARWTTQPGLGGMADGLSRWLDMPDGLPRITRGQPDRVNRLKALGNAVVPQVVAILGSYIMEADRDHQQQ